MSGFFYNLIGIWVCMGRLFGRSSFSFRPISSEMSVQDNFPTDVVCKNGINVLIQAGRCNSFDKIQTFTVKKTQYLPDMSSLPGQLYQWCCDSLRCN